jgi:hypothetical protein
VKYADLSQARMTDYVFSWERMLSFQGNTAPYLQNAYVRVRSIFRKLEGHPLKSTDRWSAIIELVEGLVSQGKIQAGDKDPIIQAIRAREETMSTGIGFGVAIPHASSDRVQNLVVAFGRSSQGIEFQSLDNLPVHFVVLFVTPKDQFSIHSDPAAEIPKSLRFALRERIPWHPPAALALEAPAELALARKLVQFGETVPQVLDDFRPNILANYLFELANTFHAFYEACPVLKAEEPARGTRLALCDLTGRILHKGLELMGIRVPERM